MNIQATYDDLIRRTRETSLLGSCMALLSWDEQTYMPPGGLENRSNQSALLAGLHHERATDPVLGDLLARLEDSELVRETDSPEAVNVRELRRAYDRATRLPKSLVEELARTTSHARHAWLEARHDSDFALFAPWLKEIMHLKRQEAECFGFEVSPYDPLLDEYEPGATSRDITALFAALRAELVPLVQAIAGSPRQADPSILQREFPVDRQRQFGEAAATALGFDFERGRLDTTAHPFCTRIGPGDCRITTRFRANGFNDAFFGILHEVGHGLYDQGLDAAHHGTPMGEAVSLGIHESQSRLWENAVGRSRSFWEHFFPLARRLFPEALRGVELDDFHFAVNHVARSLNRVESDEVTYNLHILVRFELEQALMTGDLLAADVPAAWNEKYHHYLGLTPPNDAQGCLQDIHWSEGLVGYFPTYTLGNLYAAQLFASAAAEFGDLDESFARGEFAELLEWLRSRVHRHGHRYRPARLIAEVTGAPPDHRPLIEGLKRKYGALYGV
jgi:carboxypeptidase Taq